MRGAGAGAGAGLAGGGSPAGGGVAAAIHVPAIHSCEATTAAVAEAPLVIASVRTLKRRSPRARWCAGTPSVHDNEDQLAWASIASTTPLWAVQASVRSRFPATSALTSSGPRLR